MLGIPHLKGPHGLRNESAERKTQRVALTLPFTKLTVRFVRDYEQYLASLGNRETTVQKELHFLKMMVLRAVEDDLLPIEKNPFVRIKLRETKARPKAKLLYAEVSRLEALPVEQLTYGQRVARDTWLLFYLLGSRIGDVVTLR